MELVIVDLTDRFPVTEETGGVAPDFVEMLEILARRYRLRAYVDSADSGLAWRTRLDAGGLNRFFERVGTSADLGGPLSAAVVYDLTDAASADPAVITTRHEVAEDLARAGFVALAIDPHHPLSEIPERLAWFLAVRSV